MRVLHAAIRQHAARLNMSQGALLKLAREVAENAALPSLDLLTESEALRMIGHLDRAKAVRLVELDRVERLIGSLK